MSWNGLSNAASVAQLAGVDAVGLISMIQQAARTAHQNKLDCEHMARSLDMLPQLLLLLEEQEQDDPPEAMRRWLAGLRDALKEAHGLVMSCQRKGRTYRFLKGSSLADRFHEVDKKINFYLSLFPLLSHAGLARRLGGTSSSAEAAELIASFTLPELAAATDNFSFVLSDGDSATVYRGRLQDGREVAVKRLKPGQRSSAAAEDAFFTEVSILSPLRHDHIVRLVGSCADDGQRIIVTYPCTTNGSLCDHLHTSSSSPVKASWKTRVQVLLGAARAVKHLHCHAVPLVIHANVTSSSILLEASTYAPRLSGFGASVWRAAGVESQPVQVVAAAGYADPEYCSTGRLRPANDVYGLGVVMLEVLTGKPPVVTVWDEGACAMAPMTLVSFALPSIQTTAGTRLLLDDVLDRRPASNPQLQRPLEMVANMAARCLCLHGDNRPPIADVVAGLEEALRLISSCHYYS